jgi:protein AFG1
LQINVVKGRDMTIKGYGKVARINFKKVFNGAYGASDFIAMTKNFQAIFVEDIYQISMKDSNLARRFILFVSLSSPPNQVD